MGSSPHTRGALRRCGRGPDRRRIIPAYAGSTRRPASVTGYGPDHPRIRGEHRQGGIDAVHVAGSSPHTRGAPGLGGDRRRRQRIIPAYAGSTTSRLPRPLPETDHPRIRGEHFPPTGMTRGGRGSSPHTRGARPAGRRGRRLPGIIPAYAGSTRRISDGGRWLADHPRIRGEHR